jgi:hypothetical protein
MMGIAFLPIEIDAQLPNEARLLDFCNQNKMPDDHGHYWNTVPVLTRAPAGYVHNKKSSTNLMNNRYNAGLGVPQYVNNIDKEFPEIPYMLEQLPFKELTLVVIFQQIKTVEYHIDGLSGDIILDPSEVSLDLEPRRYNILLTKHEYRDCFFVSDKIDGNKYYTNITRETPCHVVTDRLYPHGADYRGPNKLMLAVLGGILDREKHLKMIQQNLEKYREQAILF